MCYCKNSYIMGLCIRSCLFFIQILLIKLTTGNIQYECGTHGRFEYCIDEIPGCVIGCHCHPGYYFDTDTKICEPNSKLIEHHRRHNIVAPTRVQVPAVTPQDVISEPPSSSNPVDAEVDEISKDADNLGDWLYNQFFKTIENQVINSTNEEQIPTRRSGKNVPRKVPKRVKKKTKRKKTSRKINKNENLKRKLMRITEDRSIFEMSSSDSDSGSSDSSSSESSSKDSDEHEHKKIVMLHKKPKRPLPSFIFLPNMDTPFYPPLGLPPPPIVPMYPIVPVPPMLPVYPMPGTACPEDKNKVDSTTTLSTTDSTVTTAKEMMEQEDTVPVDAANPTEPSDPSDVPQITESTQNPPLLRHKMKKRKNIAANHNKRLEHLRQLDLKTMARQKLLHQLREKLNGSPSKPLHPWTQPGNIPVEINQMPVPDTLMINENAIPDEFPYNTNGAQKAPVQENNIPDNPGFKYISELIHRVKINNSGDLPPIDYNPAKNFELYKHHKAGDELTDLNTPMEVNRRYITPSNQPNEDSYFSNLGRQIATLIHKNDIDRQGENNQGYVHSPYFDNSPRSFWERSIRSPLNIFNSEKNQIEYLKKSNELLFDIENKVQILASTSRSLNLHEIENIVKMVETAKIKIEKKGNMYNKNSQISDKNLNVNLLPNELHRSINNIKSSILSHVLNSKSKEIYSKSKKVENNKSNATKVFEDRGLQKFIDWKNNIQQEKKNSHVPHIVAPTQQEILRRNLKKSLDLGTKRDLTYSQRLNPVLAPPDKRYGSRHLHTNKEFPFQKTLSISNNPYKQSTYFRQEMSLFDFLK